ncbi:FecR family protein [Pedobacter endophyticus]|uniref:FecR domain-containing protein n=1 Tax=Pedobacter endophyticus TaxID=2789740 RepID=A0A7S9L2S6_9SPHI|nr:FecR family protein [Pedobacter endophyticus]QPH41429.1 FecR domain-containing protein [Pedobacter endophyticus]
MNQIEFQSLLERYNNGKCSSEELALLENWYNSFGEKNKINSISEDDFILYQKLIWKNVNGKLNLMPNQQQHKRLTLWAQYSIAASLFLIISFGIYYSIKWKSSNTEMQMAKSDVKVKDDLPPASNKAELVLSNGKVISLENADPGLVATEGDVRVEKSGESIISYKQGNSDATVNNNATAYNTIRTPNGGKWPAIELPDGTKVILDAGSSITFPVSFSKERKVNITGQAYFSVIHNSKKPFLVSVQGITIEDLGTEFNVNAYNDDLSVKTTLTEGAVKVSLGNQHSNIKPGQQVLASNNKLITKEVDIEEVIAWKKGLFQFNHTAIDVVMRQISRWYDVDIVFKENVANLTFTGNISRNLKLSRSLEMLSVTGLVFKMEGKRIVVSN